MQLSCENIEEFYSRRVDARLSSVEDTAFERHLNECETCSLRYCRYEDLFDGVAAIPELVMSGSAPMPAGTSEFFKPAEKKPFLPRWISAAAVILLLSGVGKFAYEFGQLASENDDGLQNQSLAKLDPGKTQFDPTTIEYPADSSGRRLRRLRENTDNLFHLASVSKADDADADRMVQVFGDYLEASPLREDLRYFREKQRRDLGSFGSPVRKFADKVSHLLAQIDVEIHRTGRSGDRILRIQRAIEASPAQGLSRRLRRVSRNYEFPEVSEQQRRSSLNRFVKSGPSLSGVCIPLSLGMFSEASRHLELIVEEGDVGIRQPAVFFSLMNGLSGQVDIETENLRGLGAIFSGAQFEVRINRSATGSELILEMVSPNGKGPSRIRVGLPGGKKNRQQLFLLKESKAIQPKRL